MSGRPIPEMSDSQIDAEIDNHDRRKRSGGAYTMENAARYKELLKARGEREGFTFETSMAAIQTAARERRFISYGDLAEANGVPWSKAYRQIGTHLWALVRNAKREGMPIVSAIVVNKPNIETGNMEPETLAGFLRAADALGMSYSDGETFLREQQQKVFETFGAGGR